MGRYDILLQQEGKDEKPKHRPAPAQDSQERVKKLEKALGQEGATDDLKDSVFFKPQPEAPVPPVLPVLPVPPVRGTAQPKRVMKQRHPFDIYQDQYESLQQLALEERKQGGIGSMSAMVRQAIDAFIERRRKNK